MNSTFKKDLKSSQEVLDQQFLCIQLILTQTCSSLYNKCNKCNKASISLEFTSYNNYTNLKITLINSY